MQKEVKNILISALLTLLCLAAVVLLALSSCTVIVNHHDGEGVDSIEESQPISPSFQGIPLINNFPIQRTVHATHQKQIKEGSRNQYKKRDGGRKQATKASRRYSAERAKKSWWLKSA